MRRKAIRFFLIFTLVGLLVSTIVHFSLYVGWSLYEAFPRLWWSLQLLVFVGIIGLLLLKPRIRLPDHIYYGPAPVAYVLMTILTCFLFFYTPFNYFYCDYKLKEGYPDTVDGQRLLVLYHGAPPQKLNQEQFQEARLYEARKTSGHWMIVQLLPLILLYEVNKWESSE